MDDDANPMDVTEFRRMAHEVVENARDHTKGKRLTLLGYQVDGLEMAIACVKEQGVVMSLGDCRMSLNEAQAVALYELLQTFLNLDSE